MTDDYDHDEAVEELLRLWDEVYPDETDVFEDTLAAALGLFRHPGLDLHSWRRVRGDFIEQRTDEDESLLALNSFEAIARWREGRASIT